MPDTHITKNYFAHGGNDLVIGGKITFLDGAEVVNFPGSTGGSSGTVLTPAAAQADSEATTIAALKEDFNTLLAALRTAGLMETAAGGGPDAGGSDTGGGG
ncbi:MAG: Head fiber protein [Clostridia bacterium]|nr:Head fiber protein [Clostridia bacterium]